LTNVQSANLVGSLPAISGASLTGLTAGQSGAQPANAALTKLATNDAGGLTNLQSANLIGSLPAISGAALTGLPSTNVISAPLLKLQTNDASSLTNVQSANLVGSLPAISGASLTGLTAGQSGAQPTNSNLTKLGTNDGSGLTNVQYTSLSGAIWLNTSSSPTTYNITGPARLYITNSSTVLLAGNGTTNKITGTGSPTAPEKVEIDQIGTNYISSY
jgi:hypothetical protein